MQALNSLLISLRRGEYESCVILDSLSLLEKLTTGVGQYTPNELKELVNQAAEVIVLLVSPSENSPGPSLEVMLEAWKRYMTFLKQFHALIEPTLCKTFIHILRDALLTAMDSIEHNIAEGEAVAAQTFGMMNFLCQRLSASVCFFVHDAKITDTFAAMGLNAIASAYQFVQQTEQGPELLGKYQSFFSKALRSPRSERVGGDAQAQGSGSTFDLSGIPSQQSERGKTGCDGLCLPAVSAVIANLEGRLCPAEGQPEVEEAQKEIDTHCCFGLALLAQAELISASEKSCTLPLHLDGVGSASMLHLLVSAITTLIVRFPCQLQDSMLQQLLLTQAARSYAVTRNLYLRLSMPMEAEVLDAALISMCVLTQLDCSYGSVRGEVARWLLCSFVKGTRESTQCQISSSLRSFLICTKADLQYRPSILKATALTIRSILLVLCDTQATELLRFLRLFDDSSEDRHVSEALWREVPFHALKDRSQHMREEVTNLLTSATQIVVKSAALHASSTPLTDENQEKLGQALSILCSCGRGRSSSGRKDINSANSIGGIPQEPLVDLVSVSDNRAAVQFVMKIVGNYSRYLDKLYVEPSTPPPGAGAGVVDYSAFHINPSKIQCSLEVMNSLLLILQEQNLPPKIVSKLLVAGQVAAALAMRVAGLQKSSYILSQLAPCVLTAANVALTTISICCFPAFREQELELVKNMYHSLVKAAETLSSEENKECAAFHVGTGSPCRVGWRLWCLLQRSLAECVTSFPPHLKSKAKTLIPTLYLPLMSARQQGNTATINEAGQCKYQDVHAYLRSQHEQHLGQQENKENDAQTGASVLNVASDYDWTLACQRGTGSNDIIRELVKHREPVRFGLTNFNEVGRAKTA